MALPQNKTKKTDQSSQAARMQTLRSESKNAKDSNLKRRGIYLQSRDTYLQSWDTYLHKRTQICSKGGIICACLRTLRLRLHRLLSHDQIKWPKAANLRTYLPNNTNIWQMIWLFGKFFNTCVPGHKQIKDALAAQILTKLWESMRHAT